MASGRCDFRSHHWQPSPPVRRVTPAAVRKALVAAVCSRWRSGGSGEFHSSLGAGQGRDSDLGEAGYFLGIIQTRLRVDCGAGFARSGMAESTGRVEPRDQTLGLTRVGIFMIINGLTGQLIEKSGFISKFLVQFGKGRLHLTTKSWVTVLPLTRAASSCCHLHDSSPSEDHSTLPSSHPQHPGPISDLPRRLLRTT